MWLSVEPMQMLHPDGIACSLHGILFITCGISRSLYAVEPKSRVCRRVAGVGYGNSAVDGDAMLTAHFSLPDAFVLDESASSVFVCDFVSSDIRRVHLSADLFYR